MDKWIDKFIKVAESSELNCQILHRERGWVETLIISEKRCYTKSKTYDPQKGYYIGVDPKKLNQEGDLVLICGGGTAGNLRDIFLIPWKIFFETLRAGEAENTYRLPKVYMQYRFFLRHKNGQWIMSVRPAGRRDIDVTKWRHPIEGAIAHLKLKQGIG